jgi:hypothetical protein
MRVRPLGLGEALPPSSVKTSVRLSYTMTAPVTSSATEVPRRRRTVALPMKRTVSVRVSYSSWLATPSMASPGTSRAWRKVTGWPATPLAKAWR